jgi:hypothetical protein
VTVTGNPDCLFYVFIEQLASSRHIHNPIDGLVHLENWYRKVCLAARTEESWKIAHPLYTVTAGPCIYTICPVEAPHSNARDVDFVSAADREEI